MNLRRMSKSSTTRYPTAVYATSLENWEIICMFSRQDNVHADENFLV